MPNSSSRRLARWLEELVAVLLSSALAAAVRETVAGRAALVTMDDAWVQLEGGSGGDVVVRAAGEGDADFAWTSVEVRATMRGRQTVDAALVRGSLRVRGDFRALRAMWALLGAVLEESAVDPRLRALWARFDAEWPGDCGPPVPLSAQLPRHGRLLESIPGDVLRVEVPTG